MSTQLIVRVDLDLKDNAGRLAKQEGKSLSELIRELLRKYVSERDMSSHIDDLWDRLEARFAQEAVTVSDVEKAIQDVRQEKMQGRHIIGDEFL